VRAPACVWIFELNADGTGPRAIAAILNAEAIPSPGSRCNRIDDGINRKRNDAKWVASAIHGEASRGTGILNNRRSVRQVVRGRGRWVRRAGDSSKRARQAPTEAQVEHVEVRLRIVSGGL
jgi:site-specific DNA recombinase